MAESPTVMPDLVETLEELDARRTKGPWRNSHAAIYADGSGDLVGLMHAKYQSSETDPTKATPNARFIVALENAWPELRAELSCLRAEREKMVAALRGVVDAFVNPGDGGPFEAGEVPAIDVARSLLSQVSP